MSDFQDRLLTVIALFISPWAVPYLIDRTDIIGVLFFFGLIVGIGIYTFLLVVFAMLVPSKDPPPAGVWFFLSSTVIGPVVLTNPEQLQHFVLQFIVELIRE